MSDQNDSEIRVAEIEWRVREARRLMETRLQFWSGVFFRIAAIALALFGFWYLREIVTTVVVALVIASAAQTAVEPLCRKRIPFLRPHTQRVFVTILVFALMVLFVCLAIQWLLSPFQIELGKLAHNLPAYRAQLEQQMSTLKTWYETQPLWVHNLVEQQKGKMGGNDGAGVPTAWVAEFLKRTVASASHIVELVLIPVLAFYFTLDGRNLRNQFLFLVPRRRMRQALAIFSETGAIMRAYIASQFWLALIAGVLVGGFLRILGMDYAIILGLFAGITRAIPIVGPLLGGIPIVLLSFVYGAQTHNPYLWVIVLVFFTLMHLVESKFVMPKLLGHALNLHAVVIIVALLVGGQLFGPMGMFLAAPVAALIRILLMHYVIAPRHRHKPTPRKAPNYGKARVLSLERAVRHSAAATAAAVKAATSAKSATSAAKPATPGHAAGPPSH